MREMPENSIDSILTDPPYGLEFMGKDWDHGIPGIPFWAEALRVAKPGAHMLAFGGTRTHHRLMCAIEDAGWEIRDTLMWVYGGQGFTKSYNIGKKLKRWEGWGTALKPAYEIVVLCRKSIDGTISGNVLKWGVGGLNIDGCRIGTDDTWKTHSSPKGGHLIGDMSGKIPRVELNLEMNKNGRFPANFLHSGEDEIIKLFPNNTSRFFYCAKSSKTERNAGCEDCCNDHPTIKPVKLLRYLALLITPPGGTILDPFAGSGSTGVAAREEGFNSILVELDAHYCEIAKRRVA